jgi:hypothetical protein
MCLHPNIQKKLPLKAVLDYCLIKVYHPSEIVGGTEKIVLFTAFPK